MELTHYLWNKNPSTKRMLLLHGMGGTGALWRPIAATLEDTWNVLAVDQRGHGKSQIPHVPGSRNEPTYTPLDYGKDVIDTLEALKFYPTWVLGHSMGVRTACATAHLKSDWIQGLVLVDLGFSGVAGGGLGEGLAEFLKKLPMLFDSREEAKDFMAKNCPDPSIAQYLMAVSVQTPDKRLTFPFDKGALIQTIHAARDASVRTWVKELAAWKMPVLVLRGARSMVWSHEEFESEREQLKKFSNVEFHEVADAGHGLPFEQRQKFLDTVLDFISRHP